MLCHLSGGPGRRERRAPGAYRVPARLSRPLSGSMARMQPGICGVVQLSCLQETRGYGPGCGHARRQGCAALDGCLDGNGGHPIGSRAGHGPGPAPLLAVHPHDTPEVHPRFSQGTPMGYSHVQSRGYSHGYTHEYDHVCARRCTHGCTHGYSQGTHRVLPEDAQRTAPVLPSYDQGAPQRTPGVLTG